MFEVLEGEHIRLRKARECDWASMLKNVWGDEEVYRWMLYAPTSTEEEARERCLRSMRFQEENFAYFVALKATDEAVGFCGIREYEPARFEETGICIGRQHQGKGYGKEILALLLELAFRKLGAEDFRYGCFQDNVKSGSLAKRSGFLFDSSYDLTRPWDGSAKRIDSWILTRERYLSLQGQGAQPG